MKKIFLSLSAIALLAVGTVSCSSSDDSGSTPVPEELTENFGSIDGEQYPLEYTWLGYESDKSVEGSDFLEQALNPNDPNTLYVVWRFTTLTEDSNSPESTVISIYGTVVDQTKTGNARYKLPFTTDSGTVSLGTYASFNGTQYQETATDQIDAAIGQNFSYADGSENFAYTAVGTLNGNAFEMDVDHALDMLYYIEVETTSPNTLQNKAKSAFSYDKSNAKLSSFKLVK